MELINLFELCLDSTSDSSSGYSRPRSAADSDSTSSKSHTGLERECEDAEHGLLLNLTKIWEAIPSPTVPSASAALMS